MVWDQVDEPVGSTRALAGFSLRVDHGEVLGVALGEWLPPGAAFAVANLLTRPSHTSAGC